MAQPQDLARDLCGHKVSTSSTAPRNQAGRGVHETRRETRRGGGSVIAQMRSRHIHSAEMKHARVCNDGVTVRITDNNGVC